MENQNKNIPEAELNSSVSKKPKLGLIIGIAAGAVALIAAVIVAVVLLGGKGSDCKHIDENDDLKCDLCGVDYDDGEENLGPQKQTVALTVKDSDGKALSGAKLLFEAGEQKLELTSDTNGKISAELYAAKYEISIIRPEDDTTDAFFGFTLETTEITFVAGTLEYEVVLRDNNPNGTKEKPFFISDNITAISVGAGEEIFYQCRNNALSRTITIKNADLVVNYDGSSYTPTGGIIEAVIEPSDNFNSYVTFSVKNNGTQTVSTDMELVFPLGSRENPIPLSVNYIETPVVKGSSVNYVWTADKDGVLLVKSANNKNNIGMQNIDTNATASNTFGAAGEYLKVSAGNEVLITVSLTDPELSGSVDMDLRVYSGTEADPIPVIKSELEFNFAPGASLTFKAEAGKTLFISNKQVSAIVGGENKTPNSLDIISELLDESGVFTVANTADELNSITFEIKN